MVPIHLERRLPWFQAVCVVLPHFPIVIGHVVRPDFRTEGEHFNLLSGFCYASCEAIYHLTYDPVEPWVTRFGPEKHQTHWYLKHKETGERIDPTAAQFSMSQYAKLYEGERKRGFPITPSKRARVILTCVTDAYFAP